MVIESELRIVERSESVTALAKLSDPPDLTGVARWGPDRGKPCGRKYRYKLGGDHIKQAQLKLTIEQAYLAYHLGLMRSGDQSCIISVRKHPRKATHDRATQLPC